MWLRRRHEGEHDRDEGQIETEVGEGGPEVAVEEWTGVVAEASALLEGGLADSILAGWPRPSWVWINQLAHGSWEDLRDLSQKRHRWLRLWEGASTFLSAEMIACTGTPERLLALQRSALIPLELDVLDGRVEPPSSPLKLISMVGAAIDGYRFYGSPI